METALRQRPGTGRMDGKTTWVRSVRYPFLPSHPQHELARRQMKGGSGLFTAVLDCPAQAALDFCRRLRLFTLAEVLAVWKVLFATAEYDARIGSGGSAARHRH